MERKYSPGWEKGWVLEKLESQEDHPPEKRQTEGGIWQYGEFIRQLLKEKHTSYEALPKTIHLSQDWHAAIKWIVNQTVDKDVEWIYGIDKATHLGNKHPSLFRFGPKYGDKIGVTPPHHYLWDTKTFLEGHGLATEPETVGSVHTHTTQSPLWSGDLLPLLFSHEFKAGIVAVKSGNYLALKSEDTPHYNIEGWTTDFHIEFRDKFSVPYDNAPPNETDLKITEKACKLYKVGLYFGKPLEPLERIA